METIPGKCMDINKVGSFCDCVADAEWADVAAQGFCNRVRAGDARDVTGEDLAELKKALMDLEKRPDQ